MQRLPTIGPGHVVAGRFRIEGLVGEGGFGAVYRATQLNIGRTVALKVLQPDLVSRADSESRFLREAELAQRLEHPNTVRLFDFGRVGLCGSLDRSDSGLCLAMRTLRSIDGLICIV